MVDWPGWMDGPTEPNEVLLSKRRCCGCVVKLVIAKMAAVVSKTIISSAACKRGFFSNFTPLTGYVAQRSYAIRPAEIPTAK